MSLTVSWFVEPAVVTLARLWFGLPLNGFVTASSDHQFEALCSGDVDAVITAIDNVMDWNLRTPQVSDFRVVAQIERTIPVSLIARPGLSSVSDLRGGTILVDAPANGLIVAVRAYLEEQGITFGSYSLQKEGGGKQRYEVLLSGRGDATVIGPPFEDMAVAQGCVRLVRIQDVYPAFPGQGIVIRNGALPQIRQKLRAWLDAMSSARLQALQNPIGAIDTLTQSGVPALTAHAIVRSIPDTFVPDPEGLDLLMTQREKAGLPGAGVSYLEIVNPELIEFISEV